jgi:2-polyprenyl-6-methoxyphenol hydroxylase-like FAD-dependent oxidoreductase
LPAPWYKDRCVLIGDAAHATTPHLASGAAIGVEDAIVLAEELGVNQGIDAALARFMTRRFERCRLVVENSARLGELEMAAAPVEQQTALSWESSVALAQPF